VKHAASHSSKPMFVSGSPAASSSQEALAVFVQRAGTQSLDAAEMALRLREEGRADAPTATVRPDETIEKPVARRGCLPVEPGLDPADDSPSSVATKRRTGGMPRHPVEKQRLARGELGLERPLKRDDAGRVASLERPDQLLRLPPRAEGGLARRQPSSASVGSAFERRLRQNATAPTAPTAATIAFFGIRFLVSDTPFSFRFARDATARFANGLPATYTAYPIMAFRLFTLLPPVHPRV
jgi:hypothetical protein